MCNKFDVAAIRAAAEATGEIKGMLARHRDLANDTTMRAGELLRDQNFELGGAMLEIAETWTDQAEQLLASCIALEDKLFACAENNQLAEQANAMVLAKLTLYFR